MTRDDYSHSTNPPDEGGWVFAGATFTRPTDPTEAPDLVWVRAPVPPDRRVVGMPAPLSIRDLADLTMFPSIDNPRPQ